VTARPDSTTHGWSLMTPPSRGKLVILSGPSGAGKSTVLRRLLDCYGDRLHLSISATTRAPRAGEESGVDYYFLSPQEFERLRQAGEFLECCEVFGRGIWYGTPLSEVTPSLQAGKSVILEIDVEGAQKALERFPDALTIFLKPSSWEELERRLRGRNTDSEDEIQRRLEVARRELAQADRYKYQVINDDPDRAADQIARLIFSTPEANRYA